MTEELKRRRFELYQYEIEFDETPIEEAIKILQEFKARHEADGWSDIQITVEGGYEGGVEINTTGKRLETKKEQTHRLNQEQANIKYKACLKADKLIKDKQLYQELKERFEK